MVRDLMNSLQPDHTSIEMERVSQPSPARHHRPSGARASPHGYPARPPMAHAPGNYGPRRPAQRPERANSTANFPEFNQKIEQIQQSVSQVYSQIHKVKQAHEDTLNTTGDIKLHQSMAKRDDQITQTQNMIGDIKSQMRELKALKDQHMASRSIAGSQKSLLQSRYLKAGKDVKDMMLKYSAVSKNYSSQYREKLKTQYRIANPDADEDEVDRAAYDDDGGQVFAMAVSSSKAKGATKVLNSVKQRHDDVKKIEKTIEELAAMMMELAELVDEQQVQLDNIEDAVEASHTHVEEGHKAVKQAIVYRKKSRKCKWIALLLFIVILIVIGVALYFKFKK